MTLVRYNIHMIQGHADQPTRMAGSGTDAVTDAVLAAARLLVGLSTHSITSVDDSITLPQFRVLNVLGTQGPMKLTTLAEYLDVTPSPTTRMTDRLVSAGLVDRRANPASRREIVLELTDAGASLVSRVMQRRRREMARIIGRMPERQRAALIEVFETLHEEGGEPEPQPDHYADWI